MTRITDLLDMLISLERDTRNIAQELSRLRKATSDANARFSQSTADLRQKKESVAGALEDGAYEYDGHVIVVRGQDVQVYQAKDVPDRIVTRGV